MPYFEAGAVRKPRRIPPLICNLAPDPSMIQHSHRQGRWHPNCARRGTTAVEFAFVFPVFLIFLFGLIDVGRGFMVSHLLTDAARAGCRQAVLPNKTNTDVTATVTDLLSKENFSGLTPTIKVNGSAADVSSATSGDEITVVVSASTASITWLPVHRFLSGSITGQFSLIRE
jgi:Flp pilus assembly protein TadG